MSVIKRIKVDGKSVDLNFDGSITVWYDSGHYVNLTTEIQEELSRAMADYNSVKDKAQAISLRS